MIAIYNEIDPFAVKWLRNLIAAGHVADGRVDDRSIADLVPADVAGLGQRHFFAGIAGWSLALRLAGVSDTANIWTGSCPCQPFSTAGRGGGVTDVRHLWPEWFRLIRECRPAVVFGEQVASSAGLGWFDAVSSDLEGAGYAVGAADLCAAGFGAPHIRQRLYFVAYANGKHGRLLAAQRQPERADAQTERCGETDELAYAAESRRITWRRVSVEGDGRDSARIEPGRLRDSGELGNPVRPGAGRYTRAESGAQALSKRERLEHGYLGDQLRTAGTADQWSACDWIPCSDGKSRPVEPGTHPLANGVPGRMGLLRGYGNAIVPQVAAQFIRAALEAA